ncbi:MAG: MaoC family dehydratase [Planctomycetes bacterium]|nr:MaoC family dehydratase [Planctomycetota bacterium]
MDVRPHQRFSARLAIDAASISAFARAAGDENPLHHDVAYARASRYGGIVASGPQTSALLMGLAATHFSRDADMVGLEFAFRFRAAVLADDALKLEWLVAAVRPTSKPRTRVVDLYGRLCTSSGTTAVGARGRVLVTERVGTPSAP